MNPIVGKTHWSQVDFPGLLRAMAKQHAEGSRERATLNGAAVEIERCRTRETYLRRHVTELAKRLGATARELSAILAAPEETEFAEALHRSDTPRAVALVPSRPPPGTTPVPIAELVRPSRAAKPVEPKWAKWKRVAEAAQRSRR